MERQRAALQERSARLAAAERRLQLARQSKAEQRAARAAAAQRAEKEAERQANAEKRRAERQKARREQEERAAAYIEKDLAERAAQAAEERKGGALAWLRDEELAPLKPVEFEHESATVGVDGRGTLAAAVKALEARPSLRLHIAGHATGPEDPRLSSQRAQAVGAALIAMGAPPAALRAKGYGATVPLSASQRARARLRSERRTSLHAIGEVETRYGLEFGEGETEATKTEPQRKLLQHVAQLLREHPKLRLSVEGHADARGEPQPNMQLASARAQAVCAALHALGVEPPRLVSHSFGATLPIADNATAEGRQRNRRVGFLVMPDVGACEPRGVTAVR